MSDNRTTELLPCPLCGGEAEVIEADYGMYMTGYAVYCRKCCLKLGVTGRLGEAYEWSPVFNTEAEAIAAWNARAERGTLTAEQVEKAIRDCSSYASYDGCTYYASGIRLQAIADELNARAERTCHNTHENRWFKCSACGYGFTDLYAEDEGDIDEQPRYCPNCGCKAVDA